jgi:taurine dioxygenase
VMKQLDQVDRLDVRVLDAPLGAEVRGLSFDGPLDDDTRVRILALLGQHILLIFRGHPEPPTNAAYVHFGQRLGPLRASVADLSRMRDFQDVNLVSNTVEVDGVTGTGGTGVIDWHADMNFGLPATDYIALDAIELPSDGGTTKFTNLARAFEALDPEQQALAEGMSVRYTFKQDLEYAKLSPEQLASLPSVTHRLVQRRAPSQRPTLWPNVGIFDGTAVPDEGDRNDDGGSAFLEQCFAHAVSDEFVYEHRWEDGDLALWSNWSTFHRREPFDAAQRRVMRHLTISEGGPVIDARGAPIPLSH